MAEVGNNNQNNSNNQVNNSVNNPTNTSVSSVLQNNQNVSNPKVPTTEKEEKNLTRETARQMYAQQGAKALNDDNLSDDQRKALKKERETQTNADVINAGAEVAASSNNPWAKAAGYTHKGLNWLTNDKYGKHVGSLARKLNNLAPGAQAISNEASESGAADKVANALSLKNSATSKTGEEAAKQAGNNATKKTAENVAKSSAANAAGDAVQGAVAASENKKSDDFSFIDLVKNPIFWILGGGFFLIFLLIMFVIFSQLTGGGIELYRDQFPYYKMEYSETIKVKVNDHIEELTLDEYAAGVVYHEIGGFSDSMETLKAFAIAARTDGLVLMTQSDYKNKGYVESSNMLAFKKASKNSKYQQAADETSGVVIVSKPGKEKFDSNDWLFFDAIAFKESCGGKETESSFILCQKQVEIPISWLKTRASIDHLKHQSAYQSHGKGMSQWGAYYLGKEKDYTAKQILELFYDKSTIISLYEKTSYSATISPNSNGECSALKNISATPASVKQAYSPLSQILKDKNTSVNNFNNGLLNEILSAGSGTRCGVVTAAIYTVKNIASYGVRIPYKMGGYKPTTYGINGNWGKYSYHCASYNYKDGKGKWHTTYYDYLGLDCGTFIEWAYINGGVSMGSQFKNKGKAVGITEGKPGDVLYHGSTSSGTGHVMLILQYDKGKKGYYVAEAANSSDDVRIRFVKTSSLGKFTVKDMSQYFCETSGCGKSGTKSNDQLKKAFK